MRSRLVWQAIDAITVDVPSRRLSGLACKPLVQCAKSRCRTLVTAAWFSFREALREDPRAVGKVVPGNQAVVAADGKCGHIERSCLAAWYSLPDAAQLVTEQACCPPLERREAVNWRYRQARQVLGQFWQRILAVSTYRYLRPVK